MKFAPIAALLLSAAPALADDVTTSALIAAEGLAGAAAALEAQPASPDRDMALAAVRFLGGIEGAYRARWRIGATDPLLPVPALGSELPPNPRPEPMRPDFLNPLAADLGAAMRDARAALPQGGDGALVLDPGDLWLDVDGDGRRDPREGLAELAGIPIPEGLSPAIRFDAADAHWLRAYTHLIEGMSELALAFDPEPALAKRIALAEELARQFAAPPGEAVAEPNYYYEAMTFGPIVDQIAAVIQTLRNQPDPARIRAAADHIHAMIAANRDFWTAVAAETDDDREWIPNDDQQAALGFPMPPGAGPAWLAVLADAERVLRGELLIPFWRFAPGHGIDLAMWLDDPAPVDPADWIQGSAALPYARPGPTVGGESWAGFTSIFGGNAGLYMVLFN